MIARYLAWPALLAFTLMIAQIHVVYATRSQSSSTDETTPAFQPLDGIPGIEVLEGVVTLESKPVRVLAARVQPRSRTLAVVTRASRTSLRLSPGTDAFATSEASLAGYSLTDYQEVFSAHVVLSGGYLSSFTPPLPMGFVKTRGIVINRPHKSWLFNGLICITPKTFLIEQYKDQHQADGCTDSLQTGQLLALGGENVLTLTEENRALVNSVQQRAFVCTDSERRVILGVTGKTTELPLATMLVAKGTPFHCIDAISLSGQITAGLLIRGDNQSVHLGSIDIPLPNAILAR
jgi:Phosphodiester glycosidase